MNNIITSILLGIVEGITEWLPVSSTGHLILFQEFFKFNMSEKFISTFNVVIQLGAIFAVLLFFVDKLNPFAKNKPIEHKNETISLWKKVIIAVIPSAILGLLFDDILDEIFFNPTTVAVTLIVYGVIMILMERKNNKVFKINSFNELSIKTAIGIGLFQCLALIPGTSRSASTIIGATILGTSRYIATEFSFFLAIPTMFGASLLKLVKAGLVFTGAEWMILGIGSLVSFIVSILVIKFLMDYIKKHDFQLFGYYRIILGILVLCYFYI